MRIFAIDPGPESSAYIIWDTDDRIIYSYGIDKNNLVSHQLSRSIKYEEVKLVSIEMVACYGMPVGKEVFDTCLFIGRLIQISESDTGRFDSYVLVYRKDIKLHFCGTCRAKDANIRQVIIDKLGPRGTKKNPGPTYGISSHLWSALAVAVYTGETI